MTKSCRFLASKEHDSIARIWDWCPALLVSGDDAPEPRAGHVMAMDGMAAVVYGGATQEGDFYKVRK